MTYKVQTAPAVNIPSKNIITKNGNVEKKYEHNPPVTIEKKKPTQVEVHNGHDNKSPKNVDFFAIQHLRFSKIDPNTSI